MVIRLVLQDSRPSRSSKRPSTRVELRNFGVFEVKRRAARAGRNPRTGELVDVPAKLVATFKPGQVMQQRVAEFENRDGAGGKAG